MIVTAHIDVSTPKGRKIVRELERNKKVVTIINPLPIDKDGFTETTYSLEESFEKLWNKMN